LAVHPPAAGLLRFAGGSDISEQVSTDERADHAGGKEGEKCEWFHMFSFCFYRQRSSLSMGKNSSIPAKMKRK